MRDLVAVVVLGCCGCGPAPLKPRNPSPGSVHFVVQSYNVAADHFRDESTIETVGYADADIVCLQETAAEWEGVLRTRYAQQYPYMLFHAQGGSAGLAALSRYPLTDKGILPAPNGWHPAWMLEVQTEAGLIEILHLHLRAILSGRSSGATAYLTVDADHATEIQVFAPKVLTREHVLVVGDFNETPAGPAVEYLVNRGFVDILPQFHPGQGTWRSPSVGEQFTKELDHVLYDDSFFPLNSYVLRRGNSDHLPVIAHVEVVGSAATM
jgi:endonuclease/exonuclease/phosphatase (EEP) superfamily protein YafD